MSDSPAISPKLPMANTDIPPPPLLEEALVGQETSSECAVERDLQQFEASCSITAHSGSPSSTASSPSAAGDVIMDDQDLLGRPPSPLPEMDIDNDTQHPMASRELSSTVTDYEQQAPDINMIDLSSTSSQHEENFASKLFDNDVDIEHASHSTAVHPVHFYGKSSKAKGKQKAMPQSRPSVEPGDDGEDEVEISSSYETHLFVVLLYQPSSAFNHITLQNAYFYYGFSRWKTSRGN